MQHCDLISTVFPLREKLSNLYFQLLQASSYADIEEYHLFDINDCDNSDSTRTKARIIFSEFDITGYTYGSAPLQHFTHALNSNEYIRDNVKKIRNFINNLEFEYPPQLRTVDNCHCSVPIVHKFEVTNRITNKTVYPIGRTCILKFANTNTCKIIKRVNTIIIKTMKKRKLVEINDTYPSKKIWRIKSPL